ncbi:MAG TPA: C2H2-type zinc finger protein [Gammaproteobacteria bacterium]|nr:C2H2-type zinc finger protein [Gammaproteobacteria bacterium]
MKFKNTIQWVVVATGLFVANMRGADDFTELNVPGVEQDALVSDARPEEGIVDEFGMPIVGVPIVLKFDGPAIDLSVLNAQAALGTEGAAPLEQVASPSSSSSQRPGGVVQQDRQRPARAMPAKARRRTKPKAKDADRPGEKRQKPRKSDRRYKCLHCESHYSRRLDTLEHIKKEHPERVGELLQCPICSQRFLDEDHRAWHKYSNNCNLKRRDVIIQQPSYCDICRQQLFGKQELERHEKSKKHLKKLEVRDGKPERIPCPLKGCKNTRKDSSAMVQHVRERHHGETLKVCECGAGYLNDNDRSEHLLKGKCKTVKGKRRREEQDDVDGSGSKRQKTAR